MLATETNGNKSCGCLNLIGRKKEIKQAKLSTFCSTTPEKAEGLQINSDSHWQNILWCLPAYG